MRTFAFYNTVRDNLKTTKLDEAGNLEVEGIVIIKQLPNGELLEHLGYFHQITSYLKLPYNGVLNSFKEYRLKLLEGRAK